MESHSQTSLAEVIDSASFAEKFGPGWDQNVLSVVGIDIGCEQALDGARKLPLKAVDEDGFQNGSFQDDGSFPCRRIAGTIYRGGRDSRFLVSFCVVFFCVNLLVRRPCRSAELRRRGRLGHGVLRQRFEKLVVLSGIRRKIRSRQSGIGFRGGGTVCGFPVGQRHIRFEQRQVIPFLPFGLNGIFHAFRGGLVRTRHLLLLLLIRSAGAKEMGLLREGVLCDELLPLEFLNSILQLVDFGFVYFERRGNRRYRCARFRRGRLLLPARRPHDDDHEQGQANEQPGLNVFGLKARWFGWFFLDWFVHGCLLTSQWTAV